MDLTKDYLKILKTTYGISLENAIKKKGLTKEELAEKRRANRLYLEEVFNNMDTSLLKFEIEDACNV